MLHDKKSCRKTTVLLLHSASCKELIFHMQKVFLLESCNCHLDLYEVNQNHSQKCKLQQSSDSSTSYFVSSSQEPKDTEVKFPG